MSIYLGSDFLAGNLTVDSTLDASSSNPVRNSAITNALSGYLPLTGGTLSGRLFMNADTGIRVGNSNANALVIIGGDGLDTGASLQLNGVSKSGGDAGWFILRAVDGTNRYVLQGKSDGTLNWGGTKVLTEWGSSYGDNGYIKTSNAMILQWGLASGSGTSRSVTLPTAFSSTSYSVVAIPNNNSSPTDRTISTANKSTTSFTFYTDTTTGMQFQWIALGY